MATYSGAFGGGERRAGQSLAFSASRFTVLTAGRSALLPAALLHASAGSLLLVASPVPFPPETRQATRVRKAGGRAQSRSGAAAYALCVIWHQITIDR